MKQNARRSALEIKRNNIFSSFLQAKKSEMKSASLGSVHQASKIYMLYCSSSNNKMISLIAESALLSK